MKPFLIAWLICMLGLKMPGLGSVYAQTGNQIAVDQITIILKEYPEINRDQILLGEIADLEGNNPLLIEQLKDLDLGPSPPLSSTKTLTPGMIQHQISKESGQDYRVSFSGPKRAIVAREGVEITGPELEKIFTDQFYERFPDDRFKLEQVRLRMQGKLKIPKGQTEFEIQFPDNLIKHEENFSLQIKQDDKLVKQVWVSAKLRYQVKVLIAARDLQRGQGLGQQDFLVEEKSLEHVQSEYVSEPEKTAGLVCRQFIRAGTTLSMKMLDAPLLIKKGNIIMMIAENKNLRVTSPGQAMADGHLGETIPAKNLSSQKEVYGVIINADQIRINF